MRLPFVMALAAVACAALAGAHDARACGMVVGPRSLTLAELEARLPYLASERVLVVWDSATETEDFIREARFEKADQPFGFIVPVPSQPEVSKVDDPPFDRLAAAFPYESRGGLLGMGSGLGRGSGGGGAPASPEVTVLSQQRIGSFTAFVLSATEGGALDRWLADNGFGTSAPARAWIDHYVRLGFYYVAFRYEAPAMKAAPAMTSETVRLRFKTALPYYPYLEPSHAGPEPTKPRMLSVWFASQDEMVPVAARKGASSVGDAGVAAGVAAGAVEWARPWHSNDAHPRAAASLRTALTKLDKIVPATGEMTVVAFRDHKASREGWGDVLMVPRKVMAPLDDAAIAARWRLLPVLDPRLEGALDAQPLPASVAFPKPAPVAATSAAAPSASATPATGATPAAKSRCSVAVVGDGATMSSARAHGYGVAALVACIVARMRRRRRAD